MRRRTGRRGTSTSNQGLRLGRRDRDYGVSGLGDDQNHGSAINDEKTTFQGVESELLGVEKLKIRGS